ncbi:MAG: heme o synthase [Chloroflexota bacterium]|nr:heme o synthase [Chloroflexota bacterium]
MSAPPGPGKLSILLGVTIIAMFGLITLGALVRTTGSGLGCPDWPLCHGQLIPPFEYHVIIEYSHRLTATVVSILVVASAIIVWWKYRSSKILTTLTTFAVIALAVQIVLGGITVIQELPPEIVTAHLFVAQVLIATLIITLLIARQPLPLTGKDRDPIFYWVFGMAVVTMAILLSGTYIVGRNAGAVCPEWPMCINGGLPDFNLQWEHMSHRIVAGLGGLFIIIGALKCRKYKARSRVLAGMGMGAAGLLIAQVIAGAANPWFEFRAAAQVIHLSLATALWTHLVAMGVVAYRLVPLNNSKDLSFSNDGIPLQKSKQRQPIGIRTTISDYIALTKPRVMSLLLLTAFGAMVLANEGIPDFWLIATVLVGGALASGGASSINHWMDKDIDRLMSRTANRPVASERLGGSQALVFGVALNIFSFGILCWGANLFAAILAISGTLFYVLVYTHWLKRATVHNIVIGGAAGAVPPLVGWAAVTGGLSLPAFFLFAIVFFWTPPHFWALALLIRRDYADAGIPMLPVVEGEASTHRAILMYTLVLTMLTILLYTASDSLESIYLITSTVLGVVFIGYAVQLFRKTGNRASAPIYRYSLLYLAMLFIAIMVDGST